MVIVVKQRCACIWLVCAAKAVWFDQVCRAAASATALRSDLIKPSAEAQSVFSWHAGRQGVYDSFCTRSQMFTCCDSLITWVALAGMGKVWGHKRQLATFWAKWWITKLNSVMVHLKKKYIYVFWGSANVHQQVTQQVVFLVNIISLYSTKKWLQDFTSHSHLIDYCQTKPKTEENTHRGFKITT